MAERNRKLGGVEKYPEPLIVIKPDVQVNELFNESEINSLRQELKFFTEDELQAAIFQAQAEINAELLAKQTAANRFPPKNVKIQNVTSSSSRGKSSQLAKLQRSPLIEQSSQEIVQNSSVQRNLSNSSNEDNKTKKPGGEDDYDDEEYEYEDDDEFDVSHEDEEREDESEGNENSEAGNEMKEEDDESTSDDVDAGDQNVVEVKDTLKTTSPPDLLNDTLNQLFDKKDNLPELQHKPVLEPTFCQNEDVEHIVMFLDNINILFDQLFQCLQVNKTHHETLDDLEIERTNKRSKEFESRFNRAVYQLERDLRTLNKLTRNCQNLVDLMKLKCLLRGCCRLLDMLLHFIPLSGGAFFPKRIQLFIEIVVDCGTLVSRMDLTVASTHLAVLAKNLRKLDMMIIKYEKERLESTCKTIKSSAKTSRSNTSSRPLSGVPKSSQQKSNMARLRKLKPEHGNFTNLSRSKSQGRLSVGQAKSNAGETSASPYSTMPRNSTRAKSADANKRAQMASDRFSQNNTLQLSFDHLEEHEAQQDIGVQCVQSTAVQATQSSTTLKDTGVQGDPIIGSRSVSRNSGLYSLDIPFTSRHEEASSMNRVLSRIHNLELLALRQNTSSRSSHYNQPVIGQNGHQLAQPHVQNGLQVAQPHMTSSNNLIQNLTPSPGVNSSGNNPVQSSLKSVTRDFSNMELRCPSVQVNDTPDAGASNVSGKIKMSENSERKSGKVNTSSLIARLEMMKSDFLLMEQKYFQSGIY